MALWNRLGDLEASVVDDAVDRAALVKATLLRSTLHLVHADDHAVLRSAMQPTFRARRSDPRFASTGLTIEDADALLDELAAFLTEPRRNAEVEGWLAARTGADGRGVWWALRTVAPLRHAPTDDPWRFGPRPAYLAVQGAEPYAGRAAADAALGELVVRYLTAFGPATVADVAGFASVQRGRVRASLDLLDDRVVRHRDEDGRELLDVPDAPLPDEGVTAPPRLLGMWDNVLLAYADRSRLIPPEVRALVIRPNGDVLPTLLVDGRVAGVWRTVDAHLEVTAFTPLDRRTWDQLAAEAAALGAWLAPRDPHPYRRYDHWWAALPPGEVRTLPTS